MKWLVGIDPRPGSRGPLAFARWLDDASGGAHTFVGVHVLGERRLGRLLQEDPDLVNAAVKACEEVLDRTETRALLGEPIVVRAPGVEQGLRALMREHDADGIIVSRQGGRLGGLMRMGAVTRRLLHALPGVVAVVPPDLEPGDVPRGPIVALTSLAEDSVAAARFAERLGRQVERPVQAVHVHSDDEQWGEVYLPARLREDLRMRRDREADARLTAWVEAHKLGAVEPMAVAGTAVEEAIEVGRRVHAVALVVGSRGLQGVERLLTTTVAPSVAAHAGRPVIVVPAG